MRHTRFTASLKNDHIVKAPRIGRGRVALNVEFYCKLIDNVRNYGSVDLEPNGVHSRCAHRGQRNEIPVTKIFVIDSVLSDQVGELSKLSRIYKVVIQSDK